MYFWSAEYCDPFALICISTLIRFSIFNFLRQKLARSRSGHMGRVLIKILNSMHGMKKSTIGPRKSLRSNCLSVLSGLNRAVEDPFRLFSFFFQNVGGSRLNFLGKRTKFFINFAQPQPDVVQFREWPLSTSFSFGQNKNLNYMMLNYQLITHAHFIL